MKKRSLMLLCAALVCFLARAAFGDVLYSTFGINDSFDGSRGYSVVWSLDSLDPGGSLGIGSAARFQLGTGSYTLSSVSLAIGSILGTNNLAIRLVADNGGQPNGALLDTIVSHPTGIAGQAQVFTYPSSLDPVLTGGSSYWLVVEPADLNLVSESNNGAYNWFAGATLPIGTTGHHEFNFSSQDWFPWQVSANGVLPAFRIEGFAVPEPNTFSLVLVGAALFALRRGRTWARRNHDQRNLITVP